MKFLAVVMALCLFAGVAHATSPGWSTEKLLNTVINSNNNGLSTTTKPYSGSLTRVRVITTADSPTQGSGIDLSGYTKARVYIQNEQATGTLTIVPLFGNSTYSKYFVGTSRTITLSNDTYIEEVGGATDYYFKATAMTLNDGGALPAYVTIDVIPLN